MDFADERPVPSKVGKWISGPFPFLLPDPPCFFDHACIQPVDVRSTAEEEVFLVWRNSRIAAIPIKSDLFAQVHGIAPAEIPFPEADEYSALFAGRLMPV